VEDFFHGWALGGFLVGLLCLLLVFSVLELDFTTACMLPPDLSAVSEGLGVIRNNGDYDRGYSDHQA
jgi:hypothetical protein